MENKNSSDISAGELLAKLKANMEEEPSSVSSENQNGDGKKRYKFRRSGRIARSVTEEDINAQMPKNDGYSFESPVPKSEIEDLDIDALMKKYLPEEDYERMASKGVVTGDENDFVRTLSSIEMPEDVLRGENGQDAVYADEDIKSYTAPDSELYDHLSEGGKVCDVPELEERDEMADTMQAPLRPMSDIAKTIAFGDPEDEASFMSVREILAAQSTTEQKPENEGKNEDSGASSDTVAFDFSKTIEMPVACDESVGDAYDTVTFDALQQTVSEHTSSSDDAADSAKENFADDGNIEGEDDDAAWDVAVQEEKTADGTVVSTEADEYDKVSTEGFQYFEDDGSELDEALWNEAMFGVGYVTGEDNVADKSDVVSDDDSAGERESDKSYNVIPNEAHEETEQDVNVADGGTLDDNVALVPAEENVGGDVFDKLADNEFDETDANLMLAFGMEDELDAAIGKDSADQLRAEMDNMMPEEEPKAEKSKRNDSEEPVKEFVSPSEIKGILDNYKSEYGKSALRLFALIAISILLFFYENVGIFGGTQPDAFNPEYYPVVHIMTGFQLLVIGFAVMYKNVVSGFKYLINRKPTVESFLPIMLAVSALYSVLACFFPAGSGIVTFNFPMSLSLLFFVIGQRLDLRREIMTFRIISSKRVKFALEKLDIIDAELETKAFDKFLPNQPDIFRINKTSFVDGYFKRTNNYSSVKQVLLAFIPASLCAFVIGIIIGAVADRNFADAVIAGYSAFSFSLPGTIFIAFSLPMFRASKVSFDDHSAIVGESALDEYTSASSISFDDKEVFPTAGVKLRSIKVFGSGRLDTVIYYMASIYSCIGGPLSDVLNVATADLGRSQNIEVLSIDSDGVEALVDGHHLYAGKSDYLRHNGYLPVSDPEDEEVEGGDISIIFLVCDDEVVGKFYVRYRIDPEFEATLKSLYRSGICVGIKTVDPNINDDMLSTRIRLTKYPVRVLKYDDINDRSRGSDRTDSGIVSKKSVKALLRAFTLCDKTKHVTKTNLMIATLTMLVGIIVTAAVVFIGSVGAVGSVYVALFQLFWLIPVYLISKFLLM